MDHMIRPKNAIHEHVEVPYLAGPYEDGGPFGTYLERKGVDQSLMLALWQDSRMDEAFLGVVQAWLFFGVLNEVLQLNPSTSSSTFRVWKDGDGNGSGSREVLYTKGLSRRCNEFRAQLAPGQEDDDRERVQAVIRPAQLIVDTFCLSGPWTHDRQVLILSIVLLYNLIRDFWSLEFSPSIRGYLGFLETRMINDGWCKSDVEKLRYGVEPENFYFIAQMDPPTPLEDHRECQTHRCLLKQLDPSNYKTKHIHEGCECPHISASQNEMFPILKSGFVPLILWSSDGQIEIVSSQNYPTYVALSHVWSDRLGNITENSLPCCQLKQLMKLVQNLFKNSETKIPFWIDTICCPIEPREARDLAISFMRKTYGNASKLLVLDAYLQRTEMSSLGEMELLLRIICSPWTRRLWTFQEGALAKGLFLQFADGPLDFDHIAARFSGHATRLGGDRIRSTCALLRGKGDEVVIGTSLDSYRESGSTLFRVLHYLFNEIASRATSVDSDEALYIGTILGENVETIAKAPRCDRMKTFWALQKKISAAICLWNGPRLGTPGYRWAPSGFVSQTQSSFGKRDSPFDKIDASITPSGLLFDSACFSLHAWNRMLSPQFYLRDEQRRFLLVTFLSPYASEQSNTTDTTSSPQASTEAPEFALLVQPPFEFDADESLPSPHDISEGILVSINTQQDSIFHARLEGAVSIMLAGHISHAHPKISPQILEQVMQNHAEEGDQATALIPVEGLAENSKGEPASQSESADGSCENHHLDGDLPAKAQPQKVNHQSGEGDNAHDPFLPDVSSLQVTKNEKTSTNEVSKEAMEMKDNNASVKAPDENPHHSGNQDNYKGRESDAPTSKVVVLEGSGRTTSIFSEEELLMFDGVSISTSQTWCID